MSYRLLSACAVRAPEAQSACEAAPATNETADGGSEGDPEKWLGGLWSDSDDVGPGVRQWARASAGHGAVTVVTVTAATLLSLSPI